MRLWNIGAEGQLLMGAWGASAVVLVGLLPAGTSPFVTLPLMMLAGIAAGALWAGIAGWLKARFNVNEIITTLMLNYIALRWIQFWVFGPWSEGGFQMSPRFPREAWLPRLTDFAKVVPDLGGLTVHLGFVLALVAAGFSCGSCSTGRARATRSGSSATTRGRPAMPASTSAATSSWSCSSPAASPASPGASEISGVVHRLQDDFSPGYGFTGVIIAYLARFNPLGVVIASIAFGALILAGREIQPAGIPAMIQGIVLFCVIASDVFLRYRVRLVRR